MAKQQTTRTWKTLDTETRERFRDYIRRNEGVESTTLASELLLSTGTVKAIKANLYR